MAKLSVRVALIFSLVIAALLLHPSAVPAYAAGPPSSCDHITSGRPVVEVCYEWDGDDIWVKDLRKDGHSVGAHWKLDYAPTPPKKQEGYCISRKGAGIWVECNYDFKEDRRVRIWPGRYMEDFDYPAREYAYREMWT